MPKRKQKQPIKFQIGTRAEHPKYGGVVLVDVTAALVLIELSDGSSFHVAKSSFISKPVPQRAKKVVHKADVEADAETTPDLAETLTGLTTREELPDIEADIQEIETEEGFALQLGEGVEKDEDEEQFLEVVEQD